MFSSIKKSLIAVVVATVATTTTTTLASPAVLTNKINTNTLVTTGQYDVGSTTYMSKNLAENIKRSKYVEIKNGKHLCNIECSEEFNKNVELFVDQNYDEA